MQVGVLALQGDFQEHARVLHQLGAEVIEVRLPKHVDQVDALVIPGGESTTITRLLALFGLLEPIQRRIDEGMPVLGTCAGAIVLAEHATDLDRPGLGRMHVNVRRNAFGRQVDSFEADVPFPVLGDPPVHAIFIRAPVIEAVLPPARVLATLPDGTIVAAQEENMLALAFHPELTGDTRVHRYFLSLIPERQVAQTA